MKTGSIIIYRKAIFSIFIVLAIFFSITSSANKSDLLLNENNNEKSLLFSFNNNDFSFFINEKSLLLNENNNDFSLIKNNNVGFNDWINIKNIFNNNYMSIKSPNGIFDNVIHTRCNGIEKTTVISFAKNNDINVDNDDSTGINGNDIRVHHSGMSLIALNKNGIDNQHKIINAPGAIPYIENLNDEAIERFRDQIEIIDLLGITDKKKRKSSIFEATFTKH